LGAGIGTNAALHASLSKKGVYTFDIPAMNSVREIVTGKISKSVALSEITYFSDPKKLTESTKDKPYIVISYWAFTEFPLELRSQFEDLLTGAKFCFIISNPEFEGVNNFEYFESLKNRLGMQTLLFGDIHWQKLKNHRYVLLSSNQL